MPHSRPPESALPPALAAWLLRRVLPRSAVGASILGDMREEHARMVRTSSSSEADRWYRREALGIAWRAAGDRLRGRIPFTPRMPRARRRSARRNPPMARIVDAVRYSARALARTPQFTIAAVLTLALAIGTNAAVFSVVQGVLLKPLRYHDSDRLVVLRHTAPGLGHDEFGMSPGLYLLYRGESTAFASTGIYAESTVNITGDDSPPSRVAAAQASRDVFATLGMAPVLGRAFDAEEDSPGGPAVVLLGDGLWRERFGADPSVIGRTVHVDGEARTVIGVMPASFDFPSRETRVWLPLALDSANVTAYGNFSFQAVARLRDEVSPTQAQARLQPLLDRLRTDADEGGDFRAFMDAGRLAAVVKPMKTMIVGEADRAIWILLGTVGFVFLIACANVTNLFLVRSEARQKEMAVRAALGAGRTSLIGHYSAESLLIAGAGGAFGLVLAWGALRALLHIAPPNIPRLHEVAIDPVVLAFTVGVTVLAAILLGLLPTLRLTSPDLLAALSRTARGSSTGRERNYARQLLVVAQTALALVLLVGSGLMVRSFQNMRALEPGFEPRHATTFRISLPMATYADDASVTQFHHELLERLRAIPGVEQAGAVSHAPIVGCCSGTAHRIEDQPVEPGMLPPMFWWSRVSEGYFEAMRIPIVAGRAFDTRERDAAHRSVVVSQALARRIWRDGDVIGRRIRPSGGAEDEWYTVIGVVGNVRDRALEFEPGEMVYYPVASGQARSMTYVLRSARPDAITPLARAAVWELDAQMPIAASAAYEKIVADSMVRLSFAMTGLVAAAIIALILGAIGLYGVISYIVTQRTNEIGIRLALGARPAQVRRMVVLQGAKLAALGLLIGVVAALALTRLMQGMLFGTAPTDPTTFIAVSGVLAAITLMATFVPAHRASRIDPAGSLRAE